MMSSLNSVLRNGLLLFAVFCVFPVALQSQEADMEKIKELYDKARGYFDQNRYDSARYFLDLTLAEFTEESKYTKVYIATKAISNQIYLELGQFDKFRELSAEFLLFLKEHFPENHKNIADQYTQQGLSYAMAGEMRQSEPYFFKSKAMFERLKELKFGQQRRDSILNSLGLIYNYIAIVKAELNQPDSSDYYYEKSNESVLATQTPNPLTVASNYYGLGVSAYYQSNYTRAILFARKMLDVLDPENPLHQSRISGAYQFISTCKQSLLEIDSALYYSSKSLEIEKAISGGKGKSLVSAMQAQIRTLMNMGDHVVAKKLIDEALNIEMEDDIEELLLTITLYSYKAEIVIGKYRGLNEGLSYYDQALSLLKDPMPVDPQSKALLVSIYKNSAESYLAKALAAKTSGAINAADSSYQEAINRLKTALEIDMEASRGMGRSDVQILTRLGKAYMDFGEYKSAKKVLNDAIKRADKRGVKGLREVNKAHALLILAEISLEEDQVDRFEYYWKKAESVLAQYPVEAIIYRIGSYNLMAKRHLQGKHYDKALEFVEKAMKMNRLNSGETDQHPDNLSSLNVYINSLVLKPSIYVVKYKSENNLEDLKKAQQDYKQYNEELLNLITETENHHDLVDQMAVYNEEFQKTAFISHQLFELTGNEQYKEDAFNASQQSRAIMLKSPAVQNTDLSYAQIPDSLVTETTRLKSRIAYYAGLLKTAQTNQEENNRLREIQDKLFESQENMRQYKSMLQERFPEYFSFKYDNSTLTSEMVQSQLEPGTTYLEYINSEKELLVFVISPDTFKLKSIAKTENIDDLASRFSDILKKNDAKTLNESLEALFAQYIAPIQESLSGNRIIIVPDGNLWNVNFGLLKADQNAPYLIENYSIGYSYSASSFSNQKKDKSTRNGVLAFSFGKASNMVPSRTIFRGENKVELPGSALEINNLSKIARGDFFYEETATETSFKEKAKDYSIIHLAIHGEIDEFDYDRSRLYFNTNLADSLNDGLLYPFELYNMELNADMVVLSACNSGGGRISRGEGIMSLGRAFQYAGVGSLLLSKWEVSDAVAPEIITGFYQYLDEGMHKDDALRLAKLDFLKNADNLTASPYYWGSFFLLGDNEPIKLKGGTNTVQIIVILCLFLISASWAFRSRMRKGTKKP